MDRHIGDPVPAREEALAHCRRPEIMADAAIAIFKRPARSFTGQFAIDDAVLYEEGVGDFDRYSFVSGAYLYASGMGAPEATPAWLSHIIAPPGAMGENAREIIAV